MASSIELVDPKAESIRRAAALRVRTKARPVPSPFLSLSPSFIQVNIAGAIGLANAIKGSLGACSPTARS